MKVTTLLCCEDIVRDAETNSVSLHKIIDEIKAEGFPVFFSKFSIFTMIMSESGDNNKEDLSLQIFNNETLLGEYAVPVDFKSTSRAKVGIKFDSFAVMQPGIFKLILLSKNKALQEYVILANHISKAITTEYDDGDAKQIIAS